jgi:hypothetical protein
MAQYTVNYACGHAGVVTLYSNNKNRERKLEWLAGQLCPACWREKKRAEEAAKPITATLMLNGMDETADGDLVAWVVLTGGTMPVKDKIKAMGYHWGETRGGIAQLLGAARSEQAWQKMVRLEDVLNKTPAWQAEVEALKSLGAKFAIGCSDFDIAMAQNRLAEKKKIAEAVAAVPKPAKPACYPAGRWNGKIYGGNRIYVDGNEMRLSAAEVESTRQYQKEVDAYRKAVEEAKRSVE